MPLPLGTRIVLIGHPPPEAIVVSPGGHYSRMVVPDWKTPSACSHTRHTPAGEVGAGEAGSTGSQG
jgi:hypothetical protein